MQGRTPRLECASCQALHCISSLLPGRADMALSSLRKWPLGASPQSNCRVPSLYCEHVRTTLTSCVPSAFSVGKPGTAPPFATINPATLTMRRSSIGGFHERSRRVARPLNRSSTLSERRYPCTRPGLPAPRSQSRPVGGVCSMRLRIQRSGLVQCCRDTGASPGRALQNNNKSRIDFVCLPRIACSRHMIHEGRSRHDRSVPRPGDAGLLRASNPRVGQDPGIASLLAHREQGGKDSNPHAPITQSSGRRTTHPGHLDGRGDVPNGTGSPNCAGQPAYGRRASSRRRNSLRVHGDA
jgi:hypothetical protein